MFIKFRPFFPTLFAHLLFTNLNVQLADNYMGDEMNDDEKFKFLTFFLNLINHKIKSKNLFQKGV